MLFYFDNFRKCISCFGREKKNLNSFFTYSPEKNQNKTEQNKSAITTKCLICYWLKKGIIHENSISFRSLKVFFFTWKRIRVRVLTLPLLQAHFFLNCGNLYCIVVFITVLNKNFSFYAFTQFVQMNV